MPNPFVRDADLEVFAHPAAVRSAGYTAEEQDALLARAREVAPDPEVFKTRAPFFFRAVASNGRLDSYFTRMDGTSLKNYADDATDSRAFQNSHDFRSLGFGHTLRGHYIDGRGGSERRTEVDTIVVSGLQMNQTGNDDLIDGIRAGSIRDVSIGFYGGEYRCDLCGKDMLRDMSCFHVPGLTYDAPEGEEAARWQERVKGMDAARLTRAGEKEKPQAIATATIRDARLSELSAVYDGACPGATIIKAYREAEAGRLRGPQARWLEERYRMRLPERSRSHAVLNFEGSGVYMPDADVRERRGAMPEGQEGKEQGGAPNQPSLADAVRGMLQAAAIDPKDESPLIVAQRLINDAAQVPPLRETLAAANARIAELEPRASDGETYRKHLVDATCAEAVRAHGNDFDPELERKLLLSADLETIKARHTMYEKLAKARLGGGRQTMDDPNPPEKQRGEGSNAAYAV